MPSNITTNIDVQRYFAAFLSTYEGPPGGLWFKDVMKIYESDAITDVMPGGRGTAGLQPFGYGNCRSDRMPATFRYQISKVPYADDVALNRQEYQADKLGIFVDLVENMGTKAATSWHKNVLALIVANGNCYDAAPFFGPHAVGVDVNGVPIQIVQSGGLVANNASTGTAVVYSNVANSAGASTTGGPSVVAMPAAALGNSLVNPSDVQAANLITEAIGVMVGQPDYAGDFINGGMQAMTIVCPDPFRYAAVMSALTKTFLSGAQSNPVSGFQSQGWKINAVMYPPLATVSAVVPGSAAGTAATAGGLKNTLHFFRTDDQVKPFLGTEDPAGIVPFFQGPDSEFAQNCDMVRFNVRVDRGNGYGEPAAALQVVLSQN